MKYRDFSDWRRRAPQGLFDGNRPALSTLTDLEYLLQGEQLAQSSAHWLALVEDNLRHGMRARELWPYLRNAISAARRLNELQETTKQARVILKGQKELLKAFGIIAKERRLHGELPWIEELLDTWAHNLDHMNRTAIHASPWKFRRRLTKITGAPCSGKTSAILKACEMRSHAVQVFEGSLLTPDYLAEAIEQVYKADRQLQKAVQRVFVIERAEHLPATTMKAVEAYLQGKLTYPGQDKPFPGKPWVEIVLECNQN